MQTVCFNSLVQPLPLPSVPWWGSQPVYGESFGQLKPISVDHPTGANELVGIGRQGTRVAEQVPAKENPDTSQFTIFPGDCKDPVKEQKTQQGNLSRRSSQSGFQNCFELGLGQPLVCTNYPYIDQYYGVLATYGTQSAAGRIMLPLNVKSEDGPIFVNAKQYHGILRRRQSRAKAELQNKLVKVRKTKVSSWMQKSLVISAASQDGALCHGLSVTACQDRVRVEVVSTSSSIGWKTDMTGTSSDTADRYGRDIQWHDWADRYGRDVQWHDWADTRTSPECWCTKA